MARIRTVKPERPGQKWARDFEAGTWLYRIYSADDTLLYVGVTTNPVERLRSYAHKRGRKWWVSVDRITLLWFAENYEALAAERTVIKSERPVHNKRSANGPL